MSSDKELEQMLEDCFQAIDLDNNGVLDRGEILKVLSQVNQHPCVKVKKTDKEIEEDVQLIMEGLDKNNDQKISREEFKDFFKVRINIAD